MTRLPILLVLLLATACTYAGPDESYRQAAQALSSGQGTEAAQAVDDLHQAGQFAPESFLLLGNARATAGQIPEAMAAYRRALLLDPGQPEARQNLACLARQQGVAEAPPPGAFATFLARLSPSALVLAAVAAAWLGLLCLLAWLWAAWLPALVSAKWTAPAGVVLLGCSLAFGGGLLLRHRLVAPVAALRVVMADDQLLPMPARRASDSPVVEKIKAGTMARLLDDQGAWAYVEVPAGSGSTTLRGWLRGQSLQPLWNFDRSLPD